MPRTFTAGQRSNVSAARVVAHTKVEITDPDANWRDLSAAIGGVDWLNSGSIEETADGNSQRFSLTLKRDVRGFQLLSNPEFAGGSLNGYSIYDNNATGLVSITAEADAGAPSGWRMKITSAAGATINPGIGGFTRAIVEDAGVYSVNKYHKGAVIVFKILALIPVGATIEFASNGIGIENKQRWVSSKAGTGDWYEYIFELTVGTTGTFASTGYFYLLPGTFTRPATWYVRRMTATDVTATLMTSLVPLRTDAAANRKMDGTYAPILDLNRKWRVSTAILPPGQDPIASDYEEVGNGFIDRIAVKDKPAEIRMTGRDAGALLLDGYIRTKRTYGSAIGVAAETVIQQIINDNAADNNYLPSTSGGITLYVPVASGVLINTFEQQPGNLMQALNAVAQKAGGMIVRYRYDAADLNRLTMWKPNRGATVEDYSFGPTEYLAIPQNDLNIEPVKTVVGIRFYDLASGTIHTVYSPTIASQPSAAQSKYGTRYMEIEVSSSGVVNSDAKGQSYADAIRLDLETPALEQQIETYGAWFIQLGDFVKLLANGTHYDVDQLGGVVGFTHTFGAGTWRTVMNLRGKPIGRYATWLAQGTKNLGDTAAPAAPNRPRAIATPTATEADDTSRDYTLNAEPGSGGGGTVLTWVLKQKIGFAAETTLSSGNATTLPGLASFARHPRSDKAIRFVVTDTSTGLSDEVQFTIPSARPELADNGTDLTSGVNESGGKRINRVFVKPLATDPDTADSITTGITKRVTTLNEATGGGRGFSGLDASGDLSRDIVATRKVAGTARILKAVVDNFFEPSNNLLENAGFEYAATDGIDTVAQGWGAPEATAGFTEGLNGTRYTGLFSFLISLSASQTIPATTTYFSAHGSRRQIKVKVGETYVGRIKVRTDQNAAVPAGLLASARAWLRIYYSDGSTVDSTLATRSTPTSSTWVDLEFTVTIPVGAAPVDYVRFYFQSVVANPTAAGIAIPASLVWDVRFDNAELFRAAASDTEVIRSPGDATSLGTIVQNVTNAGHAGSAMQESGGNAINRLLAKPLSSSPNNADSVPTGSVNKAVPLSLINTRDEISVKGSGSAPTIAALKGMGVGGSVSISGTDQAGLITLVLGTGSAGSAGDWLRITFTTTKSPAPSVIIQIQGNSGDVKEVHPSSTTTSFDVWFEAAPLDGFTYLISYLAFNLT